MKRVISTKVDQTKYAEFLQYCAKVNKYPASALRDALDLLLSSDKPDAEKNPEPSEPKQEVLKPRFIKGTKEPEANMDEDEKELE